MRRVDWITLRIPTCVLAPRAGPARIGLADSILPVPLLLTSSLSMRYITRGFAPGSIKPFYEVWEQMRAGDE